jgi:hypothetical protein
MNPETRFRKSTLSSAVLLAMGIQGAILTLGGGAAFASPQACTDQNASQLNTDRANFTMLSPAGFVVGGTNDVSAAWDGTVYTDSSDYTGPGGATANITMSSTTPFFSYTWTAHDIQVFAPGSYSFDATLSDSAETGSLNVTVPAGKLGIHMLFDWASSSNIDVFIVINPDSVFGSGVGTTVAGSPCTAAASTPVKNCLWTGKGWAGGNKANAPTGNHTWMLASIDGNNPTDGVMGIPMPSGGPFNGFNANFNFDFAEAPTFTSGTVCNPADDEVPDQFTFTDLPTPGNPGVATGSVNEADAIFPGNSTAVSGLNDMDGDGLVSAAISVSGGTYSINGGAFTSASGTVTNNDTVTVRQTSASTEDGTRTDTLLNIGGVADTFSVTTIDRKPAAFTFADQTGVDVSTSIVSESKTISGMDSGETTPINISGGEYSLNGGAFTSVAGTVTNGDTVRVRQTSSATGATTTIATLTLGDAASGTVNITFTVSTAGGIESSGNNFTMLDPGGGITGGTNDVEFFWDQQYNTSTSDAVTPATAHMRLSSVTPFFQFNWTAHHIRVFGPGTYTIDTTCTVAQLEAGTANCNNPLETGQTQQYYTFTVGANQIGAHMLFDWNVSTNIDVVDIWDQTAMFSPSLLYAGPVGSNSTDTVWDLMSSDWDGDSQNGAAMIDGPFKGFKANFNVNFTGTLSPDDYTPTVNVTEPTGGGGCSISAKPSNDGVGRGDWWIVAGFLAWLGAIRRRFRRQTQS